jgi:hypothetical protein
MPDAPNFDDLTKEKSSPEYQRLRVLLRDCESRIDILYWIKDANGNAVKFVRNAAQRAYYAQRHHRDLIAKARQLGYSTLIEMLMLDTCLFTKNTRAGIIDNTLDDAAKKLDIIKFAYDRLPDKIRAAIPLSKRNTESLEFANGSTIEIGTSARGGTFQFLHISEFGRTSVDSPDVAREIKIGAIPAVHAGNVLAIESTAHGTAGEFHDMVQRAAAMQKEGRPLTDLDFKLHFFGWWVKPEYRLPNHLVHITQELKD